MATAEQVPVPDVSVSDASGASSTATFGQRLSSVFAAAALEPVETSVAGSESGAEVEVRPVSRTRREVTGGDRHPDGDHPTTQRPCAMARLVLLPRQGLLQRVLPHFDLQEDNPKQVPERGPAPGICLTRSAYLR